MYFDNAQQISSFMQTVYGGILIGFIYNIINRLFYAIVKNRTICDVVFWILTLIICASMFFRATFYDIRGYLLIGVVCGWFIYRILISKLIDYILDKVVKMLRKTKKKTLIEFEKKKKKYITKNKDKIYFVKSKLKKIINIPKQLKIVYNRYKSYFKDRSKMRQE